MNDNITMGNSDKSNKLSLAKALVTAIEKEDQEQESLILKDLGVAYHQELNDQLGKLTRMIHDLLNGQQMDGRLYHLTSNEIPDTKERLAYVVNMTEQAANRTLNALEDAEPLLRGQIKSAKDIASAWKKFRKRAMNVEEFRTLSDRLDVFLNSMTESMEQVSSLLSEILMAQDFQDLTGQVIRQVIDIVQEVEDRLVLLLKTTSGPLLSDKKDSGVEEKKDAHGYGPAVVNSEKNESLQSQDDVDDLLSSLGF